MEGANQLSGTSRRTDRAVLWPWLLSICVHAAILAALASVKFAKARPAQLPIPTPKVQLSQIKKNFFKPIPRHDFKLPSLNAPTRILRSDTGKPGNPAQSSISPRSLLPASGVIPPGEVEFFAISTHERKICYVVDCSGSMQGIFSQVVGRLKKSIGDLQPDQYFYLIFFGGDRLFEFGDGSLIRATNGAKSEALDFLGSVRPAGKTNALTALGKAMQIRDTAADGAGVIYFLTDGFELSPQHTKNFASKVEHLRKKFAPGTKINTIGFWAEPSDCRLLRAIAFESGGKFVFVGEQAD